MICGYIPLSLFLMLVLFSRQSALLAYCLNRAPAALTGRPSDGAVLGGGSAALQLVISWLVRLGRQESERALTLRGSTSSPPAVPARSVSTVTPAYFAPEPCYIPSLLSASGLKAAGPEPAWVHACPALGLCALLAETQLERPAWLEFGSRVAAGCQLARLALA
jgi:hypothetical protein